MSELWGWCSYPENVDWEVQQGLRTCSYRAVNEGKHMVMSPPSGRQQNSWYRDKLRQWHRQRECRQPNIVEMSYRENAKTAVIFCHYGCRPRRNTLHFLAHNSLPLSWCQTPRATIMVEVKYCVWKIASSKSKGQVRTSREQRGRGIEEDLWITHWHLLWESSQIIQ